MRSPFVAILLLATSFCTHAYDGRDLQRDCEAAETLFAQPTAGNPYETLRAARCFSYLTGLVDGYALGDYMADRIGVSLNALCLPTGDDAPRLMIKALLSYARQQAPGGSLPTHLLAAGAMVKHFSCSR